MSTFPGADFYRTVYHERNLPPDRGAELALAGRSNAGKSSALNALLGRHRLAHVSKAPGRTQALNFFRLGDGRFLVDLPGYGYAAVSRAKRELWGELVTRYLLTRRCLRGLFLICDIRRSLGSLDHQLLEWFMATGKPVHVLLTKADKLSRAQSARALELAIDSLPHGHSGVSLQLFSSLTHEGVPTARQVIHRWMQ